MNPIAFLLSEHSEFLGQNQHRVGCHDSVLGTIPSTENREGRSMVGREDKFLPSHLKARVQCPQGLAGSLGTVVPR